MSNISFEAGLVSISKPFTTKGDRPVTGVFFTVARGYSRNVNGQWENLGSIFQDCVVYGKMADNLIASNLPKGTMLSIRGRLNGSTKPEYTTQKGVTIPETFIENVVVEGLGVSLQRNTLTVSGSSANSNSAQSANRPTAKQQAPKAEEEKSLFDLSDDDDDDDIFADMDI